MEGRATCPKRIKKSSEEIMNEYEEFKKWLLKHHKKDTQIANRDIGEEVIKLRSKEGRIEYITKFYFSEDNLDMLEDIPEYVEFNGRKSIINIIRKSLGV